MDARPIRFLVALLLFAGVLIVPSVPGSPAGFTQAAGSPDVVLDKTMPAENLYGVPIPVLLTLTNPDGPDGFNASFTDVLPAGVSYVAGSGSPAPSSVTVQTDDTTLLVWSNAADMLTGAEVQVSYQVNVDLTQFVPGDTVTNSAQAFVNSDPRVLPALDPASLDGDGDDTTFTGNAADSATTTLIPFELTKQGGTSEDELLRGVHSQQTTYTLTVENNAVNPSTGISLVDYLPAQLEYLGCGPIVDNSAPLTEEYPGSGRIPVGASTADPCLTPSSVTTVDLDPDGSGPMPTGVYTRVEWDSATLAAGLGSADLAPSEQFTIAYRTAIPLQANTFPGPANPTANLDNNTGEYTTETLAESSLRNYAEVSGTYHTDTTITTGSDIDWATIEDLSIHKTVDQPTFTQDSAPIFKLLIESSEYARSTGPITVTDTIPASLDFASAVPAPDVAAPPANPDGTITFTWTLPGFTTPNAITTIVLNTEVRDDYRGSSTPVASNDTYSNVTALSADVTVMDNNDGTTGVVSVEDASSASQTAGGPFMTKSIGEPVASGTLSCGDGSGITFQPISTGNHRPGDRVCYRLRVRFPGALDTIDPIIDDYLPPGFAVEGWTEGATSDVDLSGGDVPVAPFADDVPLMRWDLADIDRGGTVFEVVVQARITEPPVAPGDIVDNLMKLRYANRAGDVFQHRDAAAAVLSKAVLELDKGVAELNGSAVAGAPADNVTVQEGDTVTFHIALSNTGTEPASNVSVRDVLPDGFTCADIVGGTISNGGECDAAENWIQWETTDGINIPAAGTAIVTYDVLIPIGVSAGATMTNTAGVRQYSGDTNTGTDFIYIPAENIDPGLVDAANAEAASDSSTVVTAWPSVDKTVTTSIDAAGNASVLQATIGETVSYTVDTVLPGGATFTNAFIRDELDAEKDLVESSVVVTRDGAAIPATFTIDTTGNSIEVEFPTPYVTAHDTPQEIQVTFDAIVTDVASNVRGAVTDNRADFEFENAAGDDRAVDGSVAVEIVEPNIVVDKTNDDADGVVVAGQTVTYTLDVENSAAAGVSVAYDTVVVDVVPPELTVQEPVAQGGVVTPGPGTASTITWNIANIAPGATTSLSYDAVTDDPLVANSPLTNVAGVETTSMPGVASGERSATSTNGDADGDGYVAEDESTVTGPILLLAKSAEPAAATVGESITYTVDVTIPDDVVAYDVTAIDDIPAGVAFESLDSVACAEGGGACTPDITQADVLLVPAGPTYSSGGDVAFVIGDLNTPAVGDRVVTITYTGYVTDDVAANDGATLTNGATINWNGTDMVSSDPTAVPDPASFDATSPEGSDSVSAVEPALSVDKAVGGQVADTDTRRAKPGDVLTFTLTVSNTGSAPAYDVTVADTMTDSAWAYADTTTGVGITNTEADPASGLEWTIDGPIPAQTGGVAGQATITYTLTVPASYDSSHEVVGVEQSNTVDISEYFALPEAARYLHPDRAYRSYDEVDPDTVTIELDLASIGNDVWFDVDDDGVQQASEPVLGNVDVIVTYLGADGEVGGGDDEIHTTTTDASGQYIVDGLPGGDYIVDVVDTDTDIFAGLAPSVDLDDGAAGTDGISAATLGEDEDKRDVDFGYTGTASLGDQLWFDQDLDGVFDANEAPLVGVTVTLTYTSPGGDVVVYTDTTDASGRYEFLNLPAGDVVVRVDPLGTTVPDGYDIVSDPDGDDNGTTDVTLTTGEINGVQDFGFAGVGTIGGFVWLDQSNDGVPDAGEPSLGGVVVQLTSFGPDGARGGDDDSVFTTTTDANGAYLFQNLPPGDFEVEVTGALPANVVNTYDPDVGGPGDSVSNVELTLASLNDLDQDFGYFADSTLGDRVWLDVDNSGGVDGGTEPGLNNVMITATYLGADGVIGGTDDEVFVTTTSGNGDYLFENIPDGLYQVKVTGGIVASLNQTFDADGPQDDNTSTATLAAENLLQDFSYAGTGSISDTVWFDRDEDGVRDAGETGLANVPVTLTWYGLNGTPGGDDDIELTTTTDADGNYGFPNLPDGEFLVEVDVSALPADMTPTFDSDGGLATPNNSTPVTLSGGADVDTIDFGYSGAGSIGDTVWFDQDGDGVLDAAEHPLEGVTVELVWDSPTGAQRYTTTTDASGEYLFSNLPPGDYDVSVIASSLPAGSVATFDGDQAANDLGGTSAVTLADGEDNAGQDFGYNGVASIGDTVYLDTNGDGTQGPDEAGIEGQTVVLTWQSPSGPVTFTTATDTSGNYLFTNLPDGNYTVTVTGGIVDLAVNTGFPSGGGSSTNDLTIAGGVDDFGQDFGYQGINSIGDTVFWDQGSDGVDDATDPGIDNVEVTLVWFGLDGVEGNADDVTYPVDTTDAAGRYGFAGLPDGSFSVAVTSGLPDGLDTATFDGDDLTADPDGSSTVNDLGVDAAAAVANLDQDFGYAGTGAIGDTIYFDVNGNGTQNPGEPGIADATVTLIWSGPDQALGTPDDVPYPSITTAADGTYDFAALPAGSFQVDVVNPLTGTTPTEDPDGGSGSTAQITLATGETDDDQDFGYTGTGSIGDVIWFDQNENGSQDVGEDGLGDVDVAVTWAGADNDLATTADNVVYAATTDSDGMYLATMLPGGRYSIVVDIADLPGDYANVYEPGSEGDSRSEIDLAGGEDNRAQDFGYSGAGEIGDTIYLDQNGDGDQDVGEPGLVGVAVEMIAFGPDGVLGGVDDSFFQTVTGPSGDYRFMNLPEGEYRVTVQGGITSVANTGDPDRPTGPGSGDSMATTTLTAASPNDVDQDFGYFADGVLGDRVWWDRNGDGKQDADEPGLGGVVLELTSPDLSSPLSATTDDNGAYLFANIPNSTLGDYVVTVDETTVPDGFTQTFDGDGDQTDATSAASLVDSDLAQDFGYNGVGSIGDTVWFDTDGSGDIAADGSEFGIEAVTVTLTWTGANGADIVFTTVTDAAGEYSFDSLPTGNFIVAVDESTLPDGVAATFDLDGDNDGSTPVGLTAAASNVDNVDFGYQGSGSIGDTVWFDRNGDGVFDANEYPVSGIEVTLTWNSSQGVETFTATTDANGMYLFDDLAPGDYSVAVTTGDLPAGMVPTFDADQGTSGLNSTSSLTLAHGDHIDDQDFGYQGSGSIGDTVYLDLDGNGVQDAGEPGVANQTVILGWDSPDGRVTFSVTTDETGAFVFDGLPAGDYDVTVVNGVVNDALNTGDPSAPGIPSVGDSTNTLTLDPGQSRSDQNFGYQGQNALGGRIWFDTSVDGIDDADEPGLGSVEVTVVWFGPDNVVGTDDDVTLPTMSTDANGTYSFIGLPDGDFSVTVSDGLPAGVDTNTYDADDLTDGADGVSLVTALGVGVVDPAANLDQDFGYTGSGQIGSAIWLDLNRDGEQDSDEPGIAGVKVVLTGGGADGVIGTLDDIVYPTQTTGPDGAYLFDNLPSGDFRVDVVNPVPGLTLTTDPEGAVDSTSTVSLDPGERDLDQDFAYVGEASVGDTIFLDVDADGTQEPNEPGLAGITVTVTSGGADGTLGTPDDIIVTVDTDANGGYLVDLLPSGPTRVTYGVDDLDAGLEPGSDLDGGDAAVTDVVLAAGDNQANVDFAVVGDATIRGVVYEDTNGNGIQDPGEPVLAGVSIEVVYAGPDGPVTLTTTSNSDGTWSIPSVPPGDYMVTVDESSVPDGLVASTAIEMSTLVPAGGVGVMSSGFAPSGSIGDTVFEDINLDGVQGPGEPGIAGVTVTVTGPHGTTAVVTGPNGIYLVDDLPPGTYEVRVDLSTLPPGITITADPDGNPDGVTTVVVGAGNDLTDVDFGATVPTVLSAFLPTTGATIVRTLVIAGLLLAAGWFLFGTSRRRRPVD